MQRRNQPILAACKDTYDRLGLVIAANGVFVLVALATLGVLPLFVSDAAGPELMAVGAVVVIGPLLYGVYALAAAVVRREDTPARLMVAGFGRRFPRAAAFAGLNGVVYAFTAFTITFWLNSPSVPLRVIGFVWAWLLLIWSVAQCYALPILVTQSLGVWASERVALYLVLRRPGAALVVAAHALTIVGVAIATVESGIGVLMGATVLLTATVVFVHVALVHTRMTLQLIDDEWAGTKPTPPELQPHTGSGG